MDTLKFLSILVFLAVTSFSSVRAESSNSIENATQVTDRSGRKDFVVYSPPDNFASKKTGNFYPSEESPKDEDKLSLGFEPGINPRLSKDEDGPQQISPDYSLSSYEDYAPVGYYRPPSFSRPPIFSRPPRYYAPAPNSPMRTSGTSVNWNVWKGDADGPPAPPPQGNKKGGDAPVDFSEYYLPADSWKGDPWMPDQMHMMMMMNQMNKPKFGGFLSKIFQDPLTLMVAVLLPLSILLAAVLPTLVNMMMNGGLPTITTTATGNTGRDLEGIEFLSPVLQTITTFGARSFDNPDCMQRIFCQVTKGPAANGTESRSFQKALYSASKFIDSHWLDTFGVKTLFDSMADGDCTKIPCSTHFSPTRSAKQKNKKAA